MTPKRKVLFLCSGNSCRSQMAEAIVNTRLGDQWEAFSAGTMPADRIHPQAVQALAEIGIHHRGVPKHIDQFRGTAFDLVVTVCDQAAGRCPLWLGKGRRLHLSFQDPAAVTGSPEEITQAFHRVRDQIAENIPPLLEQFAHPS